MANSEVKLQIKDLYKTFSTDILRPNVEVLKGVSFSVTQGNIYGFLGPNGAGKTTTIKAITGLIKPDRGTITVCGMPHDSTRAKARTGFMAEHPGFYNHLSGEELLQFYADLVGLSHKESGKRITELLSMVGLSKKGNQKIKTYSKGMLQRIALAQALINRPELLILDEPMSGLDPIGRRDFRDIMLDLAEYGVTIFFSSHILPDVESICDRVAILIDGTVQAEGEIDDIVSLEVDQFDLYFSGISIPQLKTPLLGSHKGPDSNWARVSAQNKDALMKEIIDAKAKLLRVNPVRSSLEEILIGKYREAKS